MSLDLDDRIREALAPLEAMPPLRRPVADACAPRRWVPLAIATGCVAILALGVVVVVARRPAPNRPPAATAPTPKPRMAVVVNEDQTIRLDGVTVGKGSAPVISPDGRSVAFGSEGVDGEAVRIYDGDTGQITTVLEAGGIYIYPWSPDGRLLAVVTWDGIHVVDRSGRTVFAIADSEGSPVFSPDGTQLAYPTGSSGVAAVTVTGGEPTIVVPGNHDSVTEPFVRPIAWRADGLVLLAGREILVSGTGRRIPLPGDPMDEGVAPLPITASADGRIVAFTTYTIEGQSARFNAYVINTDTGRIQTAPGTVQALTGDGSSLLLAPRECTSTVTSGSLAVRDVATLAIRQTIAGACQGGIAIQSNAAPIVPPASLAPVPLTPAAPCRGSDLRLTVNVNSASGSVADGVMVAENASGQTCDLDGPVSLAVIDETGHPLAVTVHATLKAPQVTRQVGRSPVHWLDPGALAVVYIRLSPGCWEPTPRFLQVDLPDGSQQRIELTGISSPSGCGSDLRIRPVVVYEPRFEPR